MLHVYKRKMHAAVIICASAASVGMAMQGLDVAKKAALEFLETFKQPVSHADRETLRMVARTSLRTKLQEKMADQLTDIVTDAVLAIRKDGEPIDLYMVGQLRCGQQPAMPSGLPGCPPVPSHCKDCL